MSTLDRTTFGDEYIRAELLAEFSACQSWREKAALLERIWARPNGSVPEDLIIQAARDENAAFRAWLARSAEYLPQEVERSLSCDTELVVQAALLENPSILRLHWREPFSAGPQMVRLALIRNPMLPFIDNSLILDIFNPTADIGISDRERTELILAFFTSQRMPWIQDDDDEPTDPMTSLDHYQYRETFRKIWALVRSWTGQWTKLQQYAFRGLPCEDSDRADTYASTTDHELHRVLLSGATAEDSKTLKLGHEDSDRDCRLMAYRISGPAIPERAGEADPPHRLPLWVGVLESLLFMSLTSGIGALGAYLFSWHAPPVAWASLGGLLYLGGRLRRAEAALINPPPPQ